MIDGVIHTFDSHKEAKRFDELWMLQGADKIKELKLQPKYLLLDTLRIKGEKTLQKVHYIADFEYKNQSGAVMVEDVKGFKTPLYKLKKHLFLKAYPSYIFKEI